jgi:hypothetical protein
MDNKIEATNNITNLNNLNNLNNLMNLNVSNKDSYLKNEVSRLVKENTSLRVKLFFLFLK